MRRRTYTPVPKVHDRMKRGRFESLDEMLARRLRDAAERAERQRAHKARKAEAARERALAEQPLSLHETPACLPGALLGGAL